MNGKTYANACLAVCANATGCGRRCACTDEVVPVTCSDGKTYVNLGTWVPAGHPGILRSFTHLVVRHTTAGAVATLCQWRDGQSRSFTPGWRPRKPAVGQVAIPARTKPETVPARVA